MKRTVPRKPKISVVIPAFNEEQLTSRCLDAFLRQKTDIPYEIVFVDNASTDKTPLIARKYTGKLPLRIIRVKTKGRGIARHKGFLAARAPIILSTDADCVIPPGWISDMFAPFADSEVLAVTGPYTVPKTVGRSHRIFQKVFPSYMKGYKLVFSHFPVQGYNFAIRKEAYIRSGGFDTNLNAMEDFDIGFKIRKLGKMTYINTKVTLDLRRYDSGVIAGITPYVYNAFLYAFAKKKIYLSDVR